MAETSDTITIRVPRSLKTQLEKMSQKQKTNLNLTINQILKKNVEWDDHVSQMGWLQFDPSTVKEIFMRLDEQKISEIATSVKKDIINAIKFIYVNATLENTNEFIQTWLRNTKTPFRHLENDQSHKYIVSHSIGKNWSLFAVMVTEEFVGGLGFKVGNTFADTDSYSFEILKE